MNKLIQVGFLALVIILITVGASMARTVTLTKDSDTTFKEVVNITSEPVTLSSKKSQCFNIHKQIEKLTAVEDTCLQEVADATALGIQEVAAPAQPQPIKLQSNKIQP